MYTIEYGIKLPPLIERRGKNKNAMKYPFGDMKPGGSFFVPYDDGDPDKTLSRIISSRSWFISKNGYKEKAKDYPIRNQPEKKGYRVHKQEKI